MSKLNSPTARLALLAFCLIGLGFLTVILNLMVLWFVLFAVLCGYFLFRYRNQIRRQDCILGVIFASIAMISWVFSYFLDVWLRRPGCGIYPSRLSFIIPERKTSSGKLWAGSSPPGVA